MDKGKEQIPFSLQATGRNRTGRSAKSPLATLLARTPLEEARVQELAIEYEAADITRQQHILNELTEGTVRFVVDLLTKGRKNTPDDVVSHLWFAHANALGLYDSNKGTYLKYFSRWIRQELATGSQDATTRFGVHIPVYVQTRERQVERARLSAAGFIGRDPSSTETQAEAVRLGLKVGEFAPEEIARIREESRAWATSFDQPIAVLDRRSAGDERTLHHFVRSTTPLPDHEAEIRALFPRLVAVEARMRAYLVRRFGERLIEVIFRRVFRRERFSEIACDLILTHERVRQLYNENIEHVLNTVGLTLMELDRWYDVLQQCERFLHIEGELVWECRDATKPLSCSRTETMRPIQEIIDSVDHILHNVHVVPCDEPRVNFPPRHETLLKLQAAELKAGMIPPRFTLRGVYEILWELSVELGPKNQVRRMMVTDPTPFLKERLGISRLYAFLAIHELMDRGLLQQPSLKRLGGKVRFCGPSPQELRLEGIDPFDVEPPIVIATIRLRILYLLPDERAVWHELSRRREVHRCISAHSPVELDASVWQRVIQALLHAGILVREGAHLTFLVPTPCLTVIELPVRKLYYLSPARFALLRAIQAEFVPGQKGVPLLKRLEDFVLAWAQEQGEDPLDLLKSHWLSGGDPLKSADAISGVIRLLSKGGAYAISVEGLEAFEFVSEDRIARKQRRRLLARAALQPAADHQEAALNSG